MTPSWHGATPLTTPDTVSSLAGNAAENHPCAGPHFQSVQGRMKRMNEPMTEAQSTFVETMGRYWESAGSTRVMGAIVGWLMVCEPPHQSASDLVTALSVSTGSVSTQTRALINYGLVEPVTFRGDRTRYYQIREGAWMAFMRAEQSRMD